MGAGINVDGDACVSAELPWLLSLAAGLLALGVTTRSLIDGWRQSRHAAAARLIVIS